MELFLGRGGSTRRPVPVSTEKTFGMLKTVIGPLYELERTLEQRVAK